MEPDCSTYVVPSFAKREAYDFADSSVEDLEVFKELNAISEEIEKCRLGNC